MLLLNRMAQPNQMASSRNARLFGRMELDGSRLFATMARVGTRVRMKMILAEFGGKRTGQFRLKPVYKVGKRSCPLCGSGSGAG